MSTKCAVCKKVVSASERIQTASKTWHGKCFKCVTCDVKLNLSNYTLKKEKLYCKKHAPKGDDDDEEEKVDEEEVKDEEEKGEEEEQVLKGMSDHLAELVANEEMADVHFVVKKGGEDVRIPAHRQILAANNDVFRAMLYPLQFSSDFKTASYAPAKIPNDEKDLRVDDCDADAFKKMLNIIYTDKLEDMTVDDIKDLLPLAKRFQVESLRLKCVEFMEEDVTAETCCALLEQGRKMLNESSFGMKFIEENTKEVLESDAFLTLSKESLTSILKSSKLCIDEVDLFEAVDNWAAAECKRQTMKPTGENKREVLGDTLNLIRFPEMSMAEVCSKVQSTGLLAADELLALFTYLGASKDSKPKCKWITKAREGGAAFKGTNLLTPAQQKTLAGFFGKTSKAKAKWNLVYKAKKDGMDASSFHRKCDNVGPTLVVIKSTGTNYIFGGYTEQSWSGSGSHRADSQAFLFSLVNRPNRPCRWTISNSSYAIYANSSYGPTFGSGYDIYVASAMTSTSNYCSTSGTYRCDDTSISTSNFTDYFGGSYNWSVDDIEVYAVAKKNN